MAVYMREATTATIDFTFHGERVREMIGPSRKGAEKVINKRKQQIAENRFLDVRKESEPVNFHEFAVEYMKWAKVNKKPSTYIRQLSMMRQLDEEFGAMDMRKITARQAEGYQTKRATTVKQTGLLLRPGTVNREIAVLKHMYTKAIEWEKVDGNPLKKVRLLKGETKRLRYLMPEELQKLLSNCSEHLKPIVTLAAHTGMRKSEIFGLKWDKINNEQGIISLVDTKNHERRDIPMTETVRSLLEGMGRAGDYVFSKEKGLGFSDLWGIFNTAVRESGITDFRFHDLRHTFASNLVMQGVDILTVKELMGHKKLEMTLRYAHLAPSYKTRAVSILDQVFSLASSKSEARTMTKNPASDTLPPVPALDMSLNPPHTQVALRDIMITN